MGRGCIQSGMRVTKYFLDWVFFGTEMHSECYKNGLTDPFISQATVGALGLLCGNNKLYPAMAHACFLDTAIVLDHRGRGVHSHRD